MLRRSVRTLLEVGEVSSLVMTSYVLSNGFVQDCIGAACSMDQALFRFGFKQPTRLLLVANFALAKRMMTRFCQSIVIGCFCVSSSTFLNSAVDYYFTNGFFQEVVFDGFLVARLLRWLGRMATPTRAQRIGEFFDSEVDSDRANNLAYAVAFRERMVTEGSSVASAVVAANLVTDVANILADQLEWVRIYHNEVYLKWRKARAVELSASEGEVAPSSRALLITLLRRTIKGHAASTVMSIAEIGMQWGVRMVGKAAARKVFRNHSINSVPSFWVESILLCLTSPVLARTAHLTAAMTYYALESTILPQTEGETKVQDEEEAAEKDEEAEHREQFNAAHNTNDLYAALGVDSSASSADIKKAYRQRALQYHPDRFSHLQQGEREAAQKAMPAINEAYEVLSCDSKRAAYDASRTLQGSPFDPEKPHPLAARFMGLPVPVQVVCGLTVVTSFAWAGGLAFYAHVKNHFLVLTQPSRGPVRHMCGAT
ncbi:DNA-J protein, putative [Bodo saltans]|uniref:DNA-J protein, putative n=1 Tax=Bodo saltans TaxID=75058 RepID=A0A0S4KPE8_BODSA|nr:DNA-J protein, putative [Bodo saltans]|eukprot:CUI15434.1 DNA-J protein, putative [Bodo saltans]